MAAMLGVLKAANSAKMAKDAFADPTMGGNVDLGREGAPAVVFNTTKREVFTPSSGYKQLFRRLRSTFRPSVNKDEITARKLEGTGVLVLGCPREKFTAAELEAIKDYVLGGGSLLIVMGEGGEEQNQTNINYLLEEFGISVNDDCVVRTVHYKYLHPKEVHIADGVMNREISNHVGKGHAKTPSAVEGAGAPEDGLAFVYPYGATLTVQRPAVPILSSGKIAYPMSRTVGAMWMNPKGEGRVAVLGSGAMFSDEYLDKEDNNKLMDFCFRWLTPGSRIELYDLDGDDADTGEYQHLPDTEALAERLRCCLQETEELPKDFTTLFDHKLYKLSPDLLPEAVGLYEKLNVKKAPLTLISPQFETPLPPLQPAVFPPTVREPPPPALDLFDLDEHFASQRARLAHLTNKCTDGTVEDVEYYIREGASILGVQSPDGDNTNPKALLAEIFRRVVEFKKSSHLDAAAAAPYMQDQGAFGAM